MSRTFYLTTAIAYVNSKPHMGHAMEFIIGDALLRYHRLIGDDTYGLTGTDEHGMKIAQTAKKAGVDTQAFVDQNAQTFRALQGVLNLSYDQFIRTTDRELHWPGVEKMWRALVEAGDIYKGSYEGYYCVGCEAFVAPNDLADGKCPIHGEPAQKIHEDNYFFKLSKYAEPLQKEIESGKFSIIPEYRRNEILNVIKNLKDVSFSRPRSVLQWGVPVPGDPDQIMYVWCDALTNYISALGYGTGNDKFQQYWEKGNEIVQVIGKDILRFHAAIWPAMLMAAKVRRPSTLLVHGFVQMGGEKMSKSKGNVVDPVELVQEWGIDPLRWYLLREIPMGADGDFTPERFGEVYASELANTIGNLVQRVCTLVMKNDVSLQAVESQFQKYITDRWKAYKQSIDEFKLHDACKEAKDLAGYVNQQIDQDKPWELAKNNDPRLAQVLSNYVGMIRAVTVLLYPLIPQTSTNIRARLGLPEIDPNGFNVEHELQAGTNGVKIVEGTPLFPRKEK